MRRTLLALATASFVGYSLFLHSVVYYGRESIGLFTDFRADGVYLTYVTPGQPAGQAGFMAGDRIVRMNELVIRTSLDMQLLFATIPLQKTTAWTIERAGAVIPLTVRPLGRQWSVPENAFLVGSVGFGLSLVLGVLLLWRGPPGGPTWIGAWLLMSLGCAFLPLMPNSLSPLWRDLPVPIQALIWPAAISSMAGHLIFLVFCARVPRPLLSRAQLAVAAIPGVAITIYMTLFVTTVVYSVATTQLMPLPDWLYLVAPLSYPVYFVVCALLLMRSVRSATDATDRRRAQTLLTGTIIGGAGLLVFGLGGVARLAARTEPVGVVLLISISLFCVLPVSFAYAMLRHRLFDIRVIVRLGLQYALARGMILTVIPLMAGILIVDAAAHSDQTLQAILAERGWPYAIAAAVSTVIYFKRKDWMAALDRRFFRERYAAQQILKDVVDDIGRSASFEAAAQRVVSRIDSALHPVMTAVMMRPRTATAFSAAAMRPETSRISSLVSGHAITQVVRALGRPVVFGRKGLSDIPVDQQAWLSESNVEVVVPIATDTSKDEAVLVLGPRRSEEPYSQEDLDLLATIGASLGLLIGRASPAEASTITAATPPAAKLANRYRIGRPIGEGGMGVVFAAIDETLERPVAIKVIKDQHLHGDGLARFQREARTAASLSHPHIVTVHDFGVDDAGSPFLVMELLEGRSLRTDIKSGRVPVTRALAILAGLTSAVDAAHARGVIHRDLKPENVFLLGNGTHAKILDYGIAKALQSEITFATPGVIGTLAYMSPEQASGGEVSPAWDVWALSVIAYEMVTGQHPFGGGLPITKAPPTRMLAPDLDDGVAAAIDQGLSLSFSDRSTDVLRAFLRT